MRAATREMHNNDPFGLRWLCLHARVAVVLGAEQLAPLRQQLLPKRLLAGKSGHSADTHALS